MKFEPVKAICKQPSCIRTVLILIGIHSIAVGFVLMLLPPQWMSHFGFNPITENFFKVQGGVFHLVMAAAYLIAARRPVEYGILVLFSVVAKFTATIFLVTYYFFVHANPFIMLSGLADFLMGLVLLLMYRAMTVNSKMEL